MNPDLQNEIDVWIDPSEQLPGELLLNADHPHADRYHQAIQEIQQKVHTFNRMMKPKRKELARLARTGLNGKELAKKLSISPATVYKWLQEPEVLRMIALLDHLQAAHDGPQDEHRKGILYRIALDNENKRPNVSIMALTEINKMAGTYASAGNLGTGNVINIQINGELFPRGALDKPAPIYDSKLHLEEKS